MLLKNKIFWFISVILILLFFIFVSMLLKNPHSDIKLPKNYSLDKYTIAKVLETTCHKDKECSTPGEYALISSCPYTSICLANKCTVVCPSYKK